MRKWTYLVATLLMAGTTATFTGCIDTDEPEGIAELRGAKSDFIKAQAAVELVEAELRKAQVAEQELVNAGLALQNKSAEIDLQLHELDIQLKQLLIEKEEAATAQAKAEAEAAIAKAEADKTKWENEKALIVEQYKEKMLLAETATAKAQEAYKQAMEQIEASKLLLTDEEQARLNGVQAQVAYAKQAMDKAMYGYSTTVIKRILSSEVANSTTTTNPDESTETNSSTTKYYVYLITEDPTQSADGYKAGSLKKLQEQLANYSDIVADNNLEAVLDNALKNAEFALEMTQKYADNLKAILDNEYTTVADWEAEVKKLEEEIAAAKVKEQQYNIEKGKLEVANPKLISDLDATSNKLETAKNNQNSNKNKAKTAAAYSKKVEAESVKKGLNDVIPSGTTVAGYNSSTGTFAYAKSIQITEAQSQIDGWVKLIDKATKGVDLENIEWAKPQLATALAAQKEAEENYAKDYKAWEDAMAAYDESLKIELEKSEVAANAAIKKYNGLKPEDRKKEANKPITPYRQEIINTLNNPANGFNLALTLNFNPVNLSELFNLQMVQNKVDEWWKLYCAYTLGRDASKYKTMNYIGFVEHFESNIHVHLSIKYPQKSMTDEFIYDEELAIKTLWKTVQMSGTVYLDKIFSDGWFYYQTKDINFQNHLIFSSN